MSKVKVWALAAVFAVALASIAVFAPVDRSDEQEKAVGARDYWRNHDGRWNYWHDGDQRWYFTDGSHWYYNNNTKDSNAWNVYRFDKGFGRDGFQKGDYRAPAKDAKIVLPRHTISGNR